MKNTILNTILTVSLLGNIVILMHSLSSTKAIQAPNVITTIVKTDWTAIEKLFHSNPYIIKECYQDHKLGVGVKINGNIVLQAQEPEIDRIIALIQQSPNKNIAFMTE